MSIKVGDNVRIDATGEIGLVIYVTSVFVMVKVENIEIPINYALDEVTAVESYVYQVGDKGFLENGIDKYRIVANDAMNQDGTTYLAALVVMNSDSNPGYVNIREQTMGFNIEGRHPLDYEFGGNTTYNLLPPGAVI